MSRHLRDIAKLDLNLMLVFQALLEEQSVTRAAQKLGRRQSAMSEALSRLRKAFDDPLFVRSGGVMRPSPRARQLEPIVRSFIRQAARFVDTPTSFDPAQSTGEVRICMTEYGATLLLPQLYDVLTEYAPNIKLRCTPSYKQSIEASLRDSSHDLAVGALDLPSTDFLTTELFHERLVCLLDPKHPAVPTGPGNTVREEDIAHYPHLKVGVYRSRDSLIDDVLRTQKLEIADTLTVGHFLMAPSLLKNRDLMFICGERFAGELAQQHDLAVTELPWDLVSIPVQLAWHRRTEDDPLLSWIRKKIRTITRSQFNTL